MLPYQQPFQNSPIIPSGLNPIHNHSNLHLPFQSNYDHHRNFSNQKQAEDRHVSTINEQKRQQRMISNRESARRSRMRKQRRVMDLWSQVLLLRSENRKLIDRLNSVSVNYDAALRENAQLEKEATELRKMVIDLQCKEKENHNIIYSTLF